MADQGLSELCTRFRNEMNANGPNTIRSLSKVMSTTGDCPNRRISAADFKNALTAAGCTHNEEGFEVVKNCLFTADGVDYDKFYHCLTGGLNQNRMACVSAVW